MNKDFKISEEHKKIIENYFLDKYDPLKWEMGYSCELEDLPAIIPLIEIKDVGGSGETFLFGNDIHDTLIVETNNNKSIIYYSNLQNGCSSRFCDEGYEIVDNGNIKGDFVEPHIRLLNLKQCIERYNKNNGIGELKKENKKLRALGKNYAKQCEDNYNELQNLKKCFLALQKQSSKDITKLHKENKILRRALELACNKLQEIYYVGNHKVLDKYSDILFDMIENQTIENYFKSQAEQEIKKEKTTN